MSDNEDQLQSVTTTTTSTTLNSNSHNDENSISSLTAQPLITTPTSLTNTNNLRLHFSNVNYVYKQSKYKQKILNNKTNE